MSAVKIPPRPAQLHEAVRLANAAREQLIAAIEATEEDSDMERTLNAAADDLGERHRLHDGRPGGRVLRAVHSRGTIMSEDVPEYGDRRPERGANILTVEQAAELLQVRPKTVRALAAAGVIPAVKLGKFWRFNESQLRDWLLAKAAENVTARRAVPGLTWPGVRAPSRAGEDLGARLDRMLAGPPILMERKRCARPVGQAVRR